MCPHEHHPSADLQALMLPLRGPGRVTHAQHQRTTGSYAGVCWLDGFLIWPVPPNTTDCTEQDPSLDLEAVLQPAATRQRRGRTLFCVHRSHEPVVLKPGSRPAVIDGARFPAAEDLEG
jgi:hypothetical protein